MAVMQAHWDIFCRVIDNFGDIGICWRLARQLVTEHERQVQLWVDELEALRPLCPQIDPALDRQCVLGVEIVRWRNEMLPGAPPPDVVIEAFACELPNAYVTQMANGGRRPVWVNLEYLTAESWTEGCHGMASPHPSLPLVKYFYFPGFSEKTGGLLRECNWEARFRYSGLKHEENLTASLFCYTTAPVQQWLGTVTRGSQAWICALPPGQPMTAVQRHLGGNGPWRLGSLHITPQGFLAIDDYDKLLARCDLNFVRGEDSFVRAQWAGKPFIWQAYRQEQDAHLDKVEAFLERYCANMDAAMRDAVERMFRLWNTSDVSGEAMARAWNDYVANLPGIGRYNRDWARQLSGRDDLATSLVKFCADKV